MSAQPADGGSAVIDRSREVELFQLAARTSLGEAAERRLGDLLTGTVDWDYVMETGGLHGILPLLQLHLDRRETVPAPVRQALRERCERVVRSNLYLSSQLVEIADALESVARNCADARRYRSRCREAWGARARRGRFHARSTRD